MDMYSTSALSYEGVRGSDKSQQRISLTWQYILCSIAPEMCNACKYVMSSNAFLEYNAQWKLFKG